MVRNFLLAGALLCGLIVPSAQARAAIRSIERSEPAWDGEVAGSAE